MKIGLLSDSHGARRRLAAALDLLARRGAEAVVHCGDIDDEPCLEVLGRCGLPVYLTAGNMDRGLRGLDRRCAEMGITFGRHSVEVHLPDDRWLVALHGHDGDLFDELLAGRQFAYICHGHTHEMRDIRLDGVRIINPGAVKRAHVLTAALLDTEADTVEFVELPDD